MLKTETRESSQSAEIRQQTPTRELTGEYFEDLEARSPTIPSPRPLPIPIPVPWMFSTRVMI
jgi:hypothetical protein